MTTRPDIVLLVLDTQRADRLGAYGYARDTSPQFDALAADATRFTRAYAAAQWTIPSHASMFTGVYPSVHNTVQSSAALPAELPTLAERLSDAGYATAAFCNNPLVGVVNNGLRRGFQSFLNYSGLLTSHPNQAGRRRGAVGIYRQWFKRRLAGIMQRAQDSFARSEALLAFAFTPFMVPIWQTALSFKGNSARSLGDTAKLLIDRRGIDADQPVFAFINLMGVHTPYHPTRTAAEQFAPQLLRDREAQRYLQRFNGDIFGWLAPFTDMDAAHQQTLSDVYDAEVAGQDALVGAFIEQLRSAGRLDNTLLVVCADHGEHLGEKGMVGHTISAYNQLVQVPMLVRDPTGDFVRGTTRDDVISTRRMFHTLLSIAGAAEAREEQLSLARDPQADPEHGVAISEAIPLENVVGLMLRRQPEVTRARRYDQVRRAVVDARHKLIRTGEDGIELYDALADPGEEQNLSEILPERVEVLQEHLDTILRRSSGDAARAGRAEGGDDPLVQRRLKDLGYLE